MASCSNESLQYRHPLLEDHDDPEAISPNTRSDQKPKNGRAAILFHLSIFIIYTLGFVGLTVSPRLDNCLDTVTDTELIFSPAQEVMQYSKTVLHNSVNATSIYKGPPSAEIDEAWHNIFKYGNIRITEDELKRVKRTSVKLADGSGDYLGALDVYHQLHCLKYIRHYVHGYEMEKTNVPVKDHLDHCIDSLRQYLMCRPDGALLTFDWIPDLPGPWANFEVEHNCVNWDTVHSWSEMRSVDIHDPKMLVHPELGPVFPEPVAEARNDG